MSPNTHQDESSVHRRQAAAGSATHLDDHVQAHETADWVSETDEDSLQGQTSAGSASETEEDDPHEQLADISMVSANKNASQDQHNVGPIVNATNADADIRQAGSGPIQDIDHPQPKAAIPAHHKQTSINSWLKPDQGEQDIYTQPGPKLVRNSRPENSRAPVPKRPGPLGNRTEETS